MASWIYSSMCLVVVFSVQFPVRASVSEPSHRPVRLHHIWLPHYLQGEKRSFHGEPKQKTQTGLKKEKICKYLHLQAAFDSVNSSAKEGKKIALIFNSSEHSYVGRCLYKWRAEKACGIFDTFATHSGLVHDNSSEHLSSASSLQMSPKCLTMASDSDYY